MGKFIVHKSKGHEQAKRTLQEGGRQGVGINRMHYTWIFICQRKSNGKAII